MSVMNTRPENVHHYDSAEEMPEYIQKYWHQRHDLFSRYDEGIWLTDEAWYSVTPESIANKISSHIFHSLSPSSTGRVLVECFSGTGGNTISFALSGHFSRIFAIESDPSMLACAKHNAEIYGVENKIWWIQGDWRDVVTGKRLRGLLRGNEGDDVVVFASPPWGGPGYSTTVTSTSTTTENGNEDGDGQEVRRDVFSTIDMKPFGLKDLMDVLRGKESIDKRNVVLYLPRNSDLNEFAKMIVDDEESNGVSSESEVGKKTRVIHYCIRGASKALCIYLGDFDFTSIDQE